MKLETRRVWLCCLLALLVYPLTTRAQGFHYTGNSSRQFVEQFYRWYVPLARSDQPDGSWDAALKLAPPPFSADLTRLLREDAVAQGECNELVGLDFDPFLGTQDPAPTYVVGKITHAGRNYRAEIYRVDHGLQSKEPSLIAEFTQVQGRWLFVNFYYLSPKDDLLTVLKSRPRCTEPASAQKTEHEPPLVVAGSMPLYPFMARAARIQGEVRIKVTTDGEKVASAEAESGPPMLVKFAKENILTWRFAGHKPTTFVTTFKYVIEEPAQCYLSNDSLVLNLPLEVQISTKGLETCDPAVPIKRHP